MRTLTFLFAMIVPLSAAGAACEATSGERTLPLVELYTSEGCDSCPPADRWLAAQFVPGQSRSAAALAFHVDYWDRLGWKDRFASAQFTERQYRAASVRGGALVYTPQVLVQGRERGDWRTGDGARALVAVQRQPAQAALAATVSADERVVRVNVRASVRESARRPQAVVSVAYADSGLVSQVAAGENRGARLTHAHVVRALRTLPLDDAAASFAFERPGEAGSDPELVAFVQDWRDGDVLQALVIPLDGCGR